MSSDLTGNCKDIAELYFQYKTSEMTSEKLEILLSSILGVTGIIANLYTNYLYSHESHLTKKNIKTKKRDYLIGTCIWPGLIGS